jgi:hypothetical protein
VFNWLRDKLPSFSAQPQTQGISPPIPHPDPLGAVHWLEANDPANPFGVKIVNCFSTAMGLLSVTESNKIASSYGRLRSDNGHRYLGSLPKNPITVDCDLKYSATIRPADGPLHLSARMEDKWDIFLHEGHLYFSRSWTGELVHTANLVFTEDSMIVRQVSAIQDRAWGNPTMAIRQVDFLIKCLLFDGVLPAPLPPGEAVEDTKFLAIHLFGEYGRHAIAGTYEDTLPIAGLRSDQPRDSKFWADLFQPSNGLIP